MSITKTNTLHELPAHDQLPRYTWADRDQFAALSRSLGGSSDTHGADLCATDRPGHHGRYPRQYTSSGLAADGSVLPSDIDGQTMSFLASTMQRSPTAPRGVVALIGAPWATQAERDATYAWLAREAKVRCNDVTTWERAMVDATPTATPGPMPKTKTISLTTKYGTDIERALRAACSPFGSLVGPIPDLVIAYLGGTLQSSEPACGPEEGIALLRELQAVEGEWSEVLLGRFRVQLITPTSGTVIEVRRHTGGWVLRIDFGPLGSDSRADQILEHDQSMPDLPWQIEDVADTATIAQSHPAPPGAEMTVGTGGAKGMPPGIAEEMAAS